MKRYNALYYLLIVLMVMGTFAAMAQNGYGAYVLGFVAVSFGILFLFQFFQSFRLAPTKSVRLNQIEFLGLTGLSGIIGLRIFFIRFDYVEMLFVLAGSVVILIYALRLRLRIVRLSERNPKLIFLIICYYVSIVFYLASMIMVPFTPVFAELAGMIGFGLLSIFLVISILVDPLLLNGEKITSFSLVTQLKDRSVLLLSLFFIFSLYMGLTKINIIPKMYSDEFPQEYFELVNRAEMGLEDPVDGVYQHEKFKEMYDTFVKRNVNSSD